VTISKIYTKYIIPPQLQEHQFRVAAVAKIICDNIPQFSSTDVVVTTCLIHDMGNIIKFDLDKFPEFLQPQGRDYWQHVKDNFISNYGSDEHKATLTIARELGVSDHIQEILNCFGFAHAVENSQKSDLDTKICVYSDFRVTPHKISSLEERLTEGYERNKNNPKMIQSDPVKFKAASEALLSIEHELFAKSLIKPQDINNQVVEKEINGLKNTEL
jgi:hypothetical protein